MELGNDPKKKRVRVFSDSKRNVLDAHLLRFVHQWDAWKDVLKMKLTRNIFLEVATVTANKLDIKTADGDDFIPTGAWFGRFKESFAMNGFHFHGEAGGVDKKQAKRDVTDKVTEKLAGVHIERIFNMDESPFYFRTLPRFGYGFKKDKGQKGTKEMYAKERITMVLCCNACGDIRIPIFYIGQHPEPQPLVRHKARAARYRVRYRAQPHAWNTHELTQYWVDHIFVPNVRKRLPRGPIYLIWDNFGGHNDIKPADKDIIILFLPPHVTCIHQPLDQGIINALKTRYRSNLVSFLLRTIKGVDFIDVMFQDPPESSSARKRCAGTLPNILEGMEMLDRIWMEDLTRKTLCRCWHHANLLPGIGQAQLAALCECLSGEDSDEDAAIKILASFQNVRVPPEVIEDVGPCSLFDSNDSAPADEKLRLIKDWLDLENCRETQEHHAQEFVNFLEKTYSVQVDGDEVHVVTQSPDASTPGQDDEVEEPVVTPNKILSTICMNEINNLTRRFRECEMEDCCRLMMMVSIAARAALKDAEDERKSKLEQSYLTDYFAKRNG